MTYFGVQIGKRPNLRAAGYAVVELCSSIVKILTLGTLYPVWEMDIMGWEIKRKIEKGKIAGANSLTTSA
jgi:hypothetical protein